MVFKHYCWKNLLREKNIAAVLFGEALPIVSIRPKNDFDLEAKYTKGMTDYLVPAPISESATLSAQEQARLAYNALEMGGIAQKDFLLPSDGIPIVLGNSILLRE